MFLSEHERYAKCEPGKWQDRKNCRRKGADGLSTLFVTDLDGTLLGADARISQESAALLRPMLDEGLPLAVATARSPATVVELLRPLGLRTPAVLMTGTMIYDVAHTRCLSATPLARETAAAVCAVLERTGQEALAYSVKGGHLYVYYKEFACEFERSFVSSRSQSPYKTFVQVEHYPEALAGGDTLMFLLALPGAEEARAVEPLSPARHVFSHLVWEMDGFACAAQSCAPPPGCVWAGRAEVDEVYTLPGAFKAYRLALKKYL